MSYVFNMVGGGGGESLKNTNAILTVTVPTGSTVTMTKGGLSLTPTMWVKAADNTLDCALFVIKPSLFDSQNAWTVTATLSGDTASNTVTIDSNEQYDMELSYHEYLYNRGNQCTELTGGWSANANESSVLLADHIYVYGNTSPRASTSNKISFAGYSKIIVHITDTNATSGNPIWISLTNVKYSLASADSVGSFSTYSSGDVQVDISNLQSATAYLQIFTTNAGSYASIDKIWYE